MSLRLVHPCRLVAGCRRRNRNELYQRSCGCPRRIDRDAVHACACTKHNIQVSAEAIRAVDMAAVAGTAGISTSETAGGRRSASTSCGRKHRTHICRASRDRRRDFSLGGNTIAPLGEVIADMSRIQHKADLALPRDCTGMRSRRCWTSCFTFTALSLSSGPPCWSSYASLPWRGYWDDDEDGAPPVSGQYP